MILKVIEAQGVGLGTEYRVKGEEGKNVVTYLGKKGEEAENYIAIDESEKAIDAKHMMIEYRSREAVYYIKDNNSDSGTFLKIQQPLKLVPGYIFAFGESSMAIAYIDGMTITLKFLGGPKEGQTLYVSAQQ